MIRRFVVVDEEGAVSADWLALGAGLVGLVLALVASLSEGTASLGETTGTAMQGAQVTTLGTLGWTD